MQCAKDYGASATIDLEHDRADIERSKIPVGYACWGEKGVIEKCFEPLAGWRHVAREESGRALPCGHYIPEEPPADLITEMLAFFEAVEQ